jgi:phospholipid transport system substrate-binding protein
VASVALALLLGAAAVPAALARGPMDDVRRHVEDAFQTFDDTDTARLSLEQRRALRRAADKIFDWPEMARTALGKHWAQMTRGERERFVRLMPRLFERVYVAMLERGGGAVAVDKIEDSMVYVGETVRGDQAVLHLKWRRPPRDIAVDCAMRRKRDGWRIHDVALDGFSVIDNYRAQFDHVIQRSSYEALVNRIDAKLNPPPASAAAGAVTARRALPPPLPRIAESP